MSVVVDEGGTCLQSERYAASIEFLYRSRRVLLYHMRSTIGGVVIYNGRCMVFRSAVRGAILVEAKVNNCVCIQRRGGQVLKALALDWLVLGGFVIKSVVHVDGCVVSVL